MTPLPPPLGSGDLLAWRLDTATFAGTWDSGEGAHRVGGRLNSKGRRAVYCALDPSTAILEVAVHKGFKTLDTVAHVLSSLQILDPALVYFVRRAEVPNPKWLVPGIPSASQQAFGDQLLSDHLFVAIPSTVSMHSWNLVFDAQRAVGAYKLVSQEPFALDMRLHPPAE